MVNLILKLTWTAIIWYVELTGTNVSGMLDFMKIPALCLEALLSGELKKITGVIFWRNRVAVVGTMCILQRNETRVYYSYE